MATSEKQHAEVTQGSVRSERRKTMTEKDRIISAIRVLAGDQGLYERERLEALKEIAEEAERQRRWLENPYVDMETELRRIADRLEGK